MAQERVKKGVKQPRSAYGRHCRFCRNGLSKSRQAKGKDTCASCEAEHAPKYRRSY